MNRHGFSVRDFAHGFPSVQERWYVASKLATDPLYPAVHDVLKNTAQPLLDVGCGMGVLAFYLRRRGWLPAITGVDLDARKIATASSLTADFGHNLAFSQSDAGESLPPHHGSVTVLDMLQYLPPAIRDDLLRQCAARVAAGGVLVIRSGIKDDSLRFQVTRCVDQLATWVNWMQATPVHYPRREELEQILGTQGMSGKFEPLWGRTPFNSWLGVFRRTADP
jgi:2-polyprenyl-3-methyl-5-hydroxy-6-metoxy-1,4-benzoquinol methylase